MKRFLMALMMMGLMSMMMPAVASASPGCVKASDGVLECTVMNSHYTGWDIWTMIEERGHLAKRGEANGVRVKVVMATDYGVAIEQYAGGNAAGVTITNMDLLTAPAVGGVSSEVVTVGDYSNGNDAVLSFTGTTMADLKGRRVLMMTPSVSDYMFSRGAEMAGLQFRDFSIANTNENQIVESFQASAQTDPQATVVTWNPWVLQLRSLPNARVIFDSSKIPGEILDLTVVRTDAPDSLKKTLAEAWYDGLADMTATGKVKREALEASARSAGCTLDQFEAQLKTTAMFWTPKDAVEFTESQKLKDTTKQVAEFCARQGLLGKKAKADKVGTRFPDGTVHGNPKNVKITYTTKWMRGAGGL